MGNVTRNKVWKLDTAATIGATGQFYRINKLRWVGATTAGHTCVITDGADNAVWASAASGSNYVEADDFSTHLESGLSINGFKLVTLASGILYVYFA